MNTESQSWWRTVQSIQEFRDRAGLGPEHFALVDLFMKQGESAASAIIIAATSEVLKAIRSDPSFPARIRELLIDEDTLMSVWVELGRTHGIRWRSSNLLQAMQGHGNNFQDPDQSSSDFSKPAAAFALSELPDRKGRYASQTVYSELMMQHAAYGLEFYSPYTTIVGPSGIGKSFAVKQLAARHGLFVSYANLASERSRVYPRPTIMGPSGRAFLRSEDAWVCYIRNQIRMATCCKTIGITAPGLFELATADTPELILKRTELAHLFQDSADVSIEAMEPVLRTAKDLLDACKLNAPSVLRQPGDDKDNGVDQRPTIICLDEARALLDEGINDSFRNLRKAAARLSSDAAFMRKDGKPVFFVVLLDTTSKISNFTPHIQYDPSSKWAHQKLFHPIHQIDTLDVFASQELLDPNGTDDAVRLLFSCGRPLWGAFLQTKYTPQDLVVFATDKVARSGTASAAVYEIAVLSYRVRFYVSSQSLAEDLVASMMRMILAIAPERNWLLTIHPSEPILAFVASRLLQQPATRLACVKAWVAALNAGTVNPGDVGEQVASLLLLFSFDYAAEPAIGLPHAISLWEFLTALLGADASDELRSVSSGVCREILDRGMVFMNHVVRTACTPTLADLNAAHRRGCALLLPPNFPGMDMAIPIRLCASSGSSSSSSGTAATAGNTSNLALLLVQIRNHKADSNTHGLEMHMREDLRTAAAALNLPDGALRGTVGLAMCLRTNAHPGCAIVLKPKTIVRQSSRRRSIKGKAPASDDVSLRAPELLALSFGLNPDVYPCLGAPSKLSRTRSSSRVEEAGESEAKRRRTAVSSKRPSSSTATHKLEREASDADAMKQVYVLLQRLLMTWPETYTERDSQSVYAKKLLDPFYASHWGEDDSGDVEEGSADD